MRWITAAFLLGIAPVAAQQTANMEAFTSACSGAQDFLIGDVPEGKDPAVVLTPLCSCLVTQFSGFSQADIDMLVTDLKGTSTDESHAAYSTYPDLVNRAGGGLNTCSNDPTVVAAYQSLQPPPPATPGRPAGVGPRSARLGRRRPRPATRR